MGSFLQWIKNNLLYLLLLILLFVVPYFLFRNINKVPDTSSNTSLDNTSSEIPNSDSEAVQKGKLLSHNNCSGTGEVRLTHLPMDKDDFVNIVPYGLMIDGHVTPIDHQYFSPTDWSLGRDSYPVYAMADLKIVDIQNRLIPSSNTDEFRLVFMHTCTFFTYYDLVTSLTPEIDAVFEKNKKNNSAAVDIDLKAGDLIGYIGGQTLDFAVWNTKEKLKGFAVPSNYDSEAWKIHTSDPYKYYSEELQKVYLEKNLRTVNPIAGKIDYDIPGKLVGTWFLKGSNGYAGNTQPYWATHLSIVYSHLDPSFIILSIGDYEGEARQFGIKGNSPDPKTVSVSTGAIKYELTSFDYQDSNGDYWDRQTPVKGIRAIEGSETYGTALIQLTDEQTIKLELFPNVTSSEVSTFTDDYRVYTR